MTPDIHPRDLTAEISCLRKGLTAKTSRPRAPAGDKTWVIYRMWALRDTEDALESLQKAFPDSGVSFNVAS